VPEPERVTLTIDGQTVQVPKGTTILEASKTLGLRIPHYCYHPGLSAVGSCRMCLVEIEKNPKLQASCATPVAQGMVVRTQAAEALKNRKSVLEFLLLNHPLDCPVCDQSGECELQNYYMAHGLYDTRFNENKKRRKKAHPIGPRVMLDQERCILCTRCVRFTQEVSKSFELGVHDRGHLSEIDVFPGEELNNPYSGNVVDICPVGALTDRDFRFQCRAWFLGRTPSVCPGCSRGCNIEIHCNERFDARYHDRRVHRLKPRYNKDVNGYWMCDEGRYAYHSIDASDRLIAPRLRNGSGWERSSWPQAIQAAAAALKSAIDEHGAGSVAVFASPLMSNEELFWVRRLFRDLLQVESIEYRAPIRKRVFSDDFLITEDKNPNSRGAELMGLAGQGAEALLHACSEGRVRFLYLCHHDLACGFDEEVVHQALAKVECTVFHGSWDHATARAAQIQLPAAVYAEKEGTFTNLQGRVQRFRAAVAPLGEALPDLDILGLLAAELNLPCRAESASQVFEKLAACVRPYAGMSHESIGDAGQLLPRAMD
jgi:NADH-quinone oxidoreductase subunit G